MLLRGVDPPTKAQNFSYGCCRAGYRKRVVVRQYRRAISWFYVTTAIREAYMKTEDETAS